MEEETTIIMQIILIILCDLFKLHVPGLCEVTRGGGNKIARHGDQNRSGMLNKLVDQHK